MRTIILAALVLAAPLGAQEPTAPLDSSAGRIIFSVYESFADSTGHTHLVLHAGAERRVHCYSPLGFRASTRGDTVAIDGWSTSWGGGCISDDDVPPQGTIPLLLAPARRVLEIVRLGAVGRYRLTVSDDAIQVRPIGTSRVSILSDTTRLWRFPRNSLALSCDAGEFTAWTCAEVEHLLADEPGLVPITFPARGRNPYSMWLGSANGVDPRRYFRVDTEANYRRLLRDLVRLHDAHAGRAAFDVSILRWTGARWSTNRLR